MEKFKRDDALARIVHRLVEDTTVNTAPNIITNDNLKHVHSSVLRNAISSVLLLSEDALASLL